MSVSPADGGDGSRGLVEDAIKILLGSVPQGWSQLHVECLPSGAASAYVGLVGTTSHWLTVPPEAANALVQYLVRSTTGSPGAQRLVVDCFPDGRLSARTEPVPASSAGATQKVAGAQPAAWPKRLLIALTAICLIAAAVVFTIGWRWSPPPEADIERLAPPPPRQQQAFDVISEWFRVLAVHDTARAQALSCANPSGTILNDIEALHGDYLGGIDHAEAIVDFRDDGAQVAAKVLLRTKPLTEREKEIVEQHQREGEGLTHRWIVLVDDGGEMKVCGSE
ncbi:hypothetical protein [Mycolicibacterium mageritense]|uniref:hypothetical protein n=1 Tax=Mycolicibacterium mageritense TaxID=53462 RepID=UPI001E42CD3F|nr:hypothetical protein [Mycolicibacterium mageritense]GJJ21664.1 hypothetical protein MTY414_53370 [Mycolicibacterium mageritense]